MSDARKKFQNLLRELFQFDCADLDFGIYRIMNQKRDVIEQFIEKDLLDAVGKALRKGALKEQNDLAEQLAALAARIREDIADDAVDADGRLAEVHAKTKLGKQYLELQSQAAGMSASDELETQVFNHLWAFFSRYYDNGDFLSTRRYSRREKYVIPYNGEEVFLHWANRDQYYIKTGDARRQDPWRGIYLRQHYHFGPGKIADYLKRFHGVSVATSSVHRILGKHGLNRLPANQKHRAHATRWKRYEKPQPGHRLQLDVKFLERIPGTRTRLYQFTAIDDCTRIRVLKVYDACNQRTAIQFVNEVRRRLPFRIRVIQTDNGLSQKSRRRSFPQLAYHQFQVNDERPSGFHRCETAR